VKEIRVAGSDSVESPGVAPRQPRVRFTRRQRRRVLAKLLFIGAGTASFLLSVFLWFIAEDRETGLYVGLWVPSIFALGALVVSWEGDA
jgi:TM2 domain-containing membrane protein YozV